MNARILAFALASLAPLATAHTASAATQDPPKSTPPKSKASKKDKDVDAAIQLCVELLVQRQESLDPELPVREWPYEGVYRVNGDIPIGYRVGGTAICASAIVDGSAGKPEGDARAAVLRGLDFVIDALDRPLMQSGFEGGYDVRGWGHAYALDFLLRLRRAELVPEEKRDAVETWIDSLVSTLQDTEIKKRGGWNYSRKAIDDCAPSTFMTVPTLLALFEARRDGEAVDAGVVERALAQLEIGRHGNGAYMYGIDPDDKKSERMDALEGAIGRSPACEVALLLGGRGDEKRVRASIEAFFDHWQHLEDRRKQQGTHKGPFGIAPYYFYYAHRYAALAIELLPEKERKKQRTRLEALLWKTRDDDGSWNDRVFPRSASYGTAMSLFALLAPSAAPCARWESTKPGTK